MKIVPRFFVLPFLLALLAGCYASKPTNVAKTATSEVPNLKVKDKKDKSTEKDKKDEVDKKPPGSEYEELVKDSDLAKHVRGEPIPTDFLCVQTGEFNVTPKKDKLLMETWCGEESPPAGGGIAVKKVEDTEAPRVPGKHVFRILFKNAEVEVTLTGAVYLRYTDAANKKHRVLLEPRADMRYMYSFADYSPKKARPIGTIRVLPLWR
jgi:hypothetical protein